MTLQSTTFDDLPPNPYMAILLDAGKDEAQKVSGIRELLDALPVSGHADYVNFRTALVAKRTALESEIENIRKMPAANIEQLLEEARDFSTPVRATQLRDSFNAFFDTAGDAADALTRIQEFSRGLERLFLLLSTAERGAEHEAFGKLSGGSVSVSGGFNNLAYDLGAELKQFNASLAAFRQDADEILKTRAEHDRGAYITSVTGNLSQGAGQEVAAPPKAAFAARKKNPSAFTA